MNVEHPYFHGHLSTRLMAMQQSQETFAGMIEHLPESWAGEHVPDILVHMAEMIRLWAQANHTILQSLPPLVSEEYQEIQFDDALKKNADKVRKIGEPGAHQAN